MKLPDDSEWFYMVSPDMAYVNVGLLKTTIHVTDMMAKIENIPAVIFDLRNYPLPSTFLICCFLTSGPQLFIDMNYIQDLSHCGSYFIKESIVDCPPDSIIDCSKKYNGKIVALTYALTGSFPEILAMQFRNYGATLIGTPTAGMYGKCGWFKMPGGIVANFSSVGCYGRNGEVVQRKGVIPDIEVYPTMESIREGKDEILEQAINYLNSLK